HYAVCTLAIVYTIHIQSALYVHRRVLSIHWTTPSLQSIAILPDLARGGAVRCVVVGVQCRDKAALEIAPSLHCHGLLRCHLACLHFVGSWRRPDRMPPCHRDSPLRHGTVWILCRDLGKNPACLLIKERVQQRHAANEFRPRVRRARHLKIYGPGSAQIPWFRDNGGFGGESCEIADQDGEKSRAGKKC